MITENLLHPYELLPLSTAGIILGVLLVLTHLYGLVQPVQTREFLVQSSRNSGLAQATLFLGLGWFFLLIAPEGWGVFSDLRVNLAEFEPMRWILQLAVPIVFFVLCMKAKELLFPRALGLVILLFVAPLLSAAYLKDPITRLLIPIWSYAYICLALVWIGKPYVYRDMVAWLVGKPGLWKFLCVAGIVYGLAVLYCAFFLWM